MPRKHAVPKREKEIGARLREIRENALLTGTAFALKHGLASGNLSKYENGWVPLPWKIGDRICAVERVSQRWLATGELPKAPYLLFPDPIIAAIPRRAVFSFAYDHFLKLKLNSTEQEFRRRYRRSAKADPWGFAGSFDHSDSGESVLLPLFHHVLDAWFYTVPEPDRIELINRLDACLRSFLLEKNASLNGASVDEALERLITEFFDQARDQASKGMPK